MVEISIFVERMIGLLGMTGSIVPIARHILLMFVAVFLSWFSYFLCLKIFVPMIEHITERTSSKWDSLLLGRKVLVSACRIVPAYVIFKLLPLVFFQEHLAKVILEQLTAIYITWAVTKLILALINAFRDIEFHQSSSTQQYLQSFCGVLKIVVIFISVIFIISLLINKSPMRLFASLGATSAILMLVFKDTIEGLVAGIRLTSNDMVHRGDWITVPSTNADGEVIDMSLTTVKVRNSDNTIVTVSPKTLVDGSFQNWKGMQLADGRQARRKIFFDIQHVKPVSEELKNECLAKGYLTQEEIQNNSTNIGLYRTYIEKNLPKIDYINENLTYLVRSLEPTPYGLPLELYFFLKNKEWKPYEHQLAEIVEWCYVKAPEFGLKIYDRCLDFEK